MLGLRVLVWLSLALTVLGANYEIAVRSTTGDIQKWGTLHLDSENLRAFEYAPTTGPADAITEGCLGVLEPAGFVCQSLFVRDESRQALLAILQRDGTLLQSVFVPGPRTDVTLQLPDEVPRPVLKPPTRAPGAQSTNRGAAAPADGEAEEPEKSFLQKYWIYIIPIALIAISNSMNGGGGAAGAAQ